MPAVIGSKRRARINRVGLYLGLSAFGLLMLFPFAVVAFGSLKTVSDVNRFPPRLLPYTQDSTEVDGEELPLYDIEGQQRVLAERVDIGVFAAPDDLEATFAAPTRDAQRRGGFLDTETVEIDGQEYELYDVDVAGELREGVVQVGSTTAGVFALPDEPSDTVTANVRTAETVDSLSFQTENYREVTELQGLDRSLTNTLLVTILVVGGTVLTSILGGYAFARIRFPGRDAIFLVYIGSIMVPFVILIIPLYQLMVALKWINSLAALVFPFVFNAYGTFLMRQFFVSIPKDLEEAAVIDGASRWTILWRIFVPLSTPAIATLATFMFLYAWNSFIWPFIVIGGGNLDNHVLTVSLQQLGGRAANFPHLIMAGVMIAIAVPVTVFVLAQRYFVENVATSGIK
jgi:ABC-type glycerol-3-phosphate transport system permease component